MKHGGTVTVFTLMPVALAKKLNAFCKRVSLTQPDVIRTLVYNAVNTYYPAVGERKTALMRSGRMQQRNFDNYDGSTVCVNAVLAARQADELETLCEGLAFSQSGFIRILVRNFIVTTKRGESEDTFLLTARLLKSRQPSSPMWGNGCERSADERMMHAIAFVTEHPGLTVGSIAAAFRGLGLRHSREWIEEVRSY